MKVSELATGESIFASRLVFEPDNLKENLALRLQRLLSKLNMGRSVPVVIHHPCVENPRRFEGLLTIFREQLLRHRPVTYSEFVASGHNKNGAAVN